MVTGTATWTVRGSDGVTTESRMPPGTLVLARPGDRDSFRWDPRRTTRHGYVHFRGNDRAEAANRPRIRDTTATPLLQSLCDHLVALGTDPSRLAEHNRLLATLLEVFLAPPVGRVLDWPDPLVAMVDHVAARWRTDEISLVPISELAAAGNVSTGHASRLFRQQFGLGPASALERIRLARAATALQRTNSTLDEIARSIGYRNPYHLSRRFSRVYQMPPSRFRNSTADPSEPLTGDLRALAARILG